MYGKNTQSFLLLAYQVWVYLDAHLGMHIILFYFPIKIKITLSIYFQSMCLFPFCMIFLHS